MSQGAVGLSLHGLLSWLTALMDADMWVRSRAARATTRRSIVAAFSLVGLSRTFGRSGSRRWGSAILQSIEKVNDLNVAVVAREQLPAGRDGVDARGRSTER
jgi:hypothetical protein